MAKFQQGWPLDYRNGGDTVDDMAQKYSKEFNKVYEHLNSLRVSSDGGTFPTEPEPYQLRIADNKVYIRNAENTAWIWLFDVKYRMGIAGSEQSVVITSDDVTTKAEPSKIVKTNSLGKIDADITGSAAKLGGYPAADYVLKSLVSATGGANKIVQTDSKGVANISIYGSATSLNGMGADYYLNVDSVARPVASGKVTYENDKIVKTKDDGLLPVDITGSAARISGISIRLDDLQDGEILVYRSGTRTFVNEAKGGSKALTITYEGVPLVQYNGDEPRTVDLSICNPFEYDGYGDIGPRLAYPFLLDSNGDITISEEYAEAGIPGGVVGTGISVVNGTYCVTYEE